jgi:SAM-dependent methyltransferase
MFRAAIQAYGTGKVKQSLWDQEFARGRWACLESTSEDVVYEPISKYAAQGSILDLGCGSGNTGNELDPGAYLKYTGVDISEVALEKARARSRESHRDDRNEYVQSDISRYVPTGRYDVILFRDSIYYIPRRRILSMLRNYSKHLTERGVFVVRIFDIHEKHADIIAMIEHSFEVVERHYSQESGVIVFR